MINLNNRLDLVVSCNNKIGESCFWDPRDNQLWWTDIEEKKIWCINQNKQTKIFNLPDRAGFILPRKQKGFIIGFAKSICVSDEELTKFTKLYDIEIEIPQTRINDGKVDPFGGIIFGTFDESDKECRRPLGSVYRISPEGLLTKLFSKVTVSNGIAFSPSKNIMYFSDTPTDIVRQFKFDKNFSIFEELEIFINKGSAPGYPDGATVDVDGNYWSARVRGGCVACYDFKGKLISKISTPTKTPTCLALGGKDLTTLFITSLSTIVHSEGSLTDLDSGNLFSLEVQTPGLKQTLASI